MLSHLSPEHCPDPPGHEPGHRDDGDDRYHDDGGVGDVLRVLLGLDWLLVTHNNILNDVFLIIITVFVAAWRLRDWFVAGDMFRSDDKKLNIFFWRQIRLWHRDKVTSPRPIGWPEVGRRMLVEELFLESFLAITHCC